MSDGVNSIGADCDGSYSALTHLESPSIHSLKEPSVPTERVLPEEPVKGRVPRPSSVNLSRSGGSLLPVDQSVL